MSSMDPTGSEIQQSEIPDVQAVPVVVETPVRTQALGALDWSTRRYLIDNTAAVKIANANPRRSRLLIACKTNDGYIGPSPAEASSTSGYQMATSSTSRQVELRHTREVWFISTNVAGSEVTVLEEFWAD